MAVKQIPISLLTTGMYITKLDISWIDSPFMYHHLMIKSQKQIDKLLKAGVKKVSIDTSKGKDVVKAPEPERLEQVDKTVTDSSEKNGPSSSSTAKPSEQGLEANSISEEMAVAHKLKGQVVKLAGEINEALKNDEAIDASQVTPLIDGTLQSLQRNSQALATLINIQNKDVSLANHAFATFSLVLSLSIKMKLGSDEQRALAQAAFFHDTGWLKLPLNLLGKGTAYTSSERRLVEQHVAVGLKTLSKNCDLDNRAVKIILQHHELCDGSGYPKGLNADAIDPLSKIFVVVVRYDELVQGLQDKPAMTPHAVLATLYKEAKLGKLDEKVVSELITLMSVYPVGSAIELSSKEKGLVVDVNPDLPKQPLVKLYYDKAGTAHAKPVLFDLAKQKGETEIIVVSVLDRLNPSTDPAGLFQAAPS